MAEPMVEPELIQTTRESDGEASSLTDEPQLHGIWLLLGRISWVVLGLGTVLVTLVILPHLYTLLQTPCDSTVATCNQFQLSPEQARLLTKSGLSLTLYASAIAFATLLVLGVNIVVSGLILWRRSHLRIGLIVALALLLLSINNFDPTNLIQGSISVWLAPVRVLTYLTSAFFLLLGFLFPNGRFVPRWTRWVCLLLLVSLFFDNFYPSLVSWTLILGIQIYRYGWVSTPRQRQQTKWVVYGVAVALMIGLIGVVFSVLPLVGFSNFSTVGFAIVTTYAAGPWLELLFPFAFAAALLRSHLWDIDVLINRTLVYGGLTAILAALYAVLIIGLESLTGRVGGTAAHSPLVLVVSTLAIAALVQPLRHRLQNVVDRRFYRQKYDAERTLAEFSALLRQEVDLEQVQSRLLAAVVDTMQPESVSLWLRSPALHPPEQTHPLQR